MAVVKPRITIQEVDGAPSGKPGTLKFPNSTLTDNGDNTFTYAPAASGGQSTFTFVVAASGGDYTTLSAAIAAASAGDSIFVKAGTYSEGGWTSSLANITIVGQNAINTILNFDANAVTHTGANLKLIGLTINSTTATITLTSTDLQIDRCILAKTSGTNNFLVSSATNLRFTNNKFTSSMAVSDNKIPISFTGAKTYMTNNYIETSTSSTSRGAIRVGAEAKVIGNTFHVVNGTSGANYCLETGANTIVSNNRFTESGNFTGTFIAPEGANIVINNNNLVNTNSVGNAIAPIAAFANLTIDGNYIQVRRGIVTAGTTTNYWRITNNYILGTIAGSIIYVFDVCAGFVITGNYIGGPASSVAIDMDAASASAGRHIITGNYFDTPTGVTMAQDNNYVADNIGTSTSILNDRKVVWMKNTSGGTLSAGAVVVYKSVAAGNEITTTTSGGDTKVFGVVTMSTTNNSFGPIQITGKTTLLMVDGNTDIAIGDHLSTFTSASIAKKASAGETVFAIALEAYTGNDSNGVIDALLIPTRMI